MLGFFALTDAADLNAVIRTAFIGLNSKPRLDVAAGGALTALSDTEGEWNVSSSRKPLPTLVEGGCGVCSSGSSRRRRSVCNCLHRPFQMDRHDAVGDGPLAGPAQSYAISSLSFGLRRPFPGHDCQRDLLQLVPRAEELAADHGND